MAEELYQIRQNKLKDKGIQKIRRNKIKPYCSDSDTASAGTSLSTSVSIYNNYYIYYYIYYYVYTLLSTILPIKTAVVQNEVTMVITEYKGYIFTAYILCLLLNLLFQPSSETLSQEQHRQNDKWKVVSQYFCVKFYDYLKIIDNNFYEEMYYQIVNKKIIPALRFQRRVLVMEPKQKPKLLKKESLTTWANVPVKVSNLLGRN